jgi:pyruvate formate lyase activating enzyme
LGNVERVDVLPFHKLGAPKFARLGVPFPLADTPVPTARSLAAVRQRFGGLAQTQGAQGHVPAGAV